MRSNVKVGRGVINPTFHKPSQQPIASPGSATRDRLAAEKVQSNYRNSLIAKGHISPASVAA